MNRTFEYPFDGDYIIENRRKLKKELLADGSNRLKKKIAVLGGSTTGTFVPIFGLFLLANGIEPDFYESEYNRWREDGTFGNPELDAFQPDIVYIHTSNYNITCYPSVSDDVAGVKELCEKQVEIFRQVWDGISERYKCPIIQNNFQMPLYRIFGNRDSVDIHGRTAFINELNRRFAEEANTRTGLYINDINYLSCLTGLDKWDDIADWCFYKLSPVTSAQPLLAHSVASIIKAVYGKNKKALALDLDNTLWGGVVGDCGAGGLEIGQESAQGQVYYFFQKYLRELSETGAVLTVVSKNDEENALEGLRHPEGCLKPENFAVIKANWERKDENVKAVAASLGLLPESFVFIDDNPAERHIVKSCINGISVPEADEPENCIKLIDRGGYFESVGFSDEDAKRNEMYRQNAARAVAEASYSDYGEYLESLEMEAFIGDFPEMYIKRISQLINKSNQFNLTTLRLTESEVGELCKKDGYIRLCGKLSDKFGDNGVVSVVFGHCENNALYIDLWLMSCRVLKRGMEQAMLCELVKKCREGGIKTIYGKYIPSAKNAMVKELYGSFGFEKLSDGDGTTVWKLGTDSFTEPELHIKRLPLTV